MSRFTETTQIKKPPTMKPKTNPEDRSQHSTRWTAVPNARMLDYLRILNCTRTTAVAPTTENQAQLCHWLFRNSVKRLALASFVSLLCLPRSGWAVLPVGDFSNRVCINVTAVATLEGSPVC